MTLRRRLALLTAASVAATALASAASVYLIVHHELFARVNRELHDVAAVHRVRGVTPGRLRNPAGRPPLLPRVISADGRIVAARYPKISYPVTAEAKDVAAGRRTSALQSVRFGSEHLQVLTTTKGPGLAFQIAESLESVDRTLHRVSLALLIFAGAAVLLAPVAGQAVAGGALGPVRRLTRTAGDIARTGDIRHRIEVRGGDELATLGASFNAMLDRLAALIETVERARRAQRQLVADASHELRTPLTSLRANVELLALGPKAQVGDRDELVGDTLGQLEGLSTLVAQLIDLAREDLREPERTPVRLDVVVEEALFHVRQNYPSIRFAVELESTTVLGTREALNRAVTNLLDNAAKWSNAGGEVEVRLKAGALEVRDHGPGIDDADLPHVFERFYRGARARERPGSGLGLAIVAQVVSSHGGEVRAEHAAGGGAVLTASFPTT